MRVFITSLVVVVVVAVVGAGAACNRERPVEAPIVDLAIAPIGDGGARALAIEGSPVQIVEAPDRSGMIGRWEGIGRQNDGQTWPLVVEMTSTRPGDVCAVADYPTVPCKAEWSCVDDVGAGVIALHESMLDDASRSNCVDHGSMTMHLESEGVIQWSWSGAGQTATARLRRTRR